MLDPPKPRRLDESVAVALEALVPAGNFYRHLEAKLDLGFVREWARELSGPPVSRCLCLPRATTTPALFLFQRAGPFLRRYACRQGS